MHFLWNAGDVRCRLPAIIMPGLELQVTLGQGNGDEPPLAEPVPTDGAAAAAATTAVVGGAAVAEPAPAPAAGEAGAGGAVPGFEPTEDQIASFIQITGAVRSVARGAFSVP